MSKNIIIQEGGVAKSLTADKLKTDLVGGGTCNWVPEDETQLITKSVTKNGTYKASSDGAYGYSKVIVNVAGGSVSGKGSDGNTHNYSTDDQGNIVDEVIPDTIEVTTPPTNPYGIYQNGQAITTEGMVVKAYNADGTEYGTVPLDEITIIPTTAVYDESTDTGGYDEATIDASVLYDPNSITQPVNAINVITEIMNNPVQTITYTPYGGAYLLLLDDGSSTVPVAIATSTGAGYREQCVNTTNPSRSYDVIRAVNSLGYATRVSNTPFGVIYGGSEYKSYEGRVRSGTATHVSTPWNSYNFDRDLATIILDGDKTEIRAGSHQQITVTWPRPGDGKELTTTFEILVAPGYTPGDSNEL